MPMVGEGQAQIGGPGNGTAPREAERPVVGSRREEEDDAALDLSWDGKGSLADFLADEDWAEARALVAELSTLGDRARAIWRSNVEIDNRIADRKRAAEEAKAALVVALKNGKPPPAAPDGGELSQLEYQRKGWEVAARDCVKETADAKAALRRETERLHVLAFDRAREAYVARARELGDLHWLISSAAAKALPEGWGRERFLAPYSGPEAAPFEIVAPDGALGPFLFQANTASLDLPRKRWRVAVKRALYGGLGDAAP